MAKTTGRSPRASVAPTAPDKTLLQRVARAQQKLQQRLPLSDRDEAALRKYQNQQRARWGAEYVEQLPRSAYLQMAGVSDHIAKKQAAQFEVEGLVGKTINLPVVLRRLHELLAEWGEYQKALAGGDEDLEGVGSDALELYRHEKYLLAQMDRLERQGKIVSLPRISRTLALLESLLREGIEILDREHGNEAGDVMRERMQEFAKIHEEQLQDDIDGSHNQPTD